MGQKIFFNYRRRKIELEAKECSSLWSKFRGLMFRNKNTEVLVFIFNKPTKAPIHSFFCKEFISVWLDDKNKIVEIKKISSWKLSIRPRKEFMKLIEIPVNDKNMKIINSLFS